MTAPACLAWNWFTSDAADNPPTTVILPSLCLLPAVVMLSYTHHTLKMHFFRHCAARLCSLLTSCCLILLPT